MRCAWVVGLVVSWVAVAPAADLPAPSKKQPVKLLEVDHYCEGVCFDHAGRGYISEGKQII